jgi:integrase
VDIRIRFPDDTMGRERAKAPVSSKSGAQRWGEARERVLLQRGPVQPTKEVPLLEHFATRFIEADAVANRQKPSEVATKRSILNAHLIPTFGGKRLDAITNADVQDLKHGLRDRAPKTVNNVLTVLSVLLKRAVEWNIVDRVPCTIRLLKVTKPTMGFWDFDEYERLVTAARMIGPNAGVIVLLGGEAGLRCGEMLGLDWTDVDFAKRHLCVQRSEWHGHVTAPKGGRLRYVPMTTRLTSTLRAHRHAKSRRVLCRDDGTALSHDSVAKAVRRAARAAKVPVSGTHRLRHTFCSHLAMRGAPARAIQEAAGHQDLTTTQRYMHLSPAALEQAIRLLEQPAPTGAWRNSGDGGVVNP